MGLPLLLVGGAQPLSFGSWADSGHVWARGRSLLHQLPALALTPGTQRYRKACQLWISPSHLPGGSLWACKCCRAGGGGVGKRRERRRGRVSIFSPALPLGRMVGRLARQRQAEGWSLRLAPPSRFCFSPLSWPPSLFQHLPFLVCACGTRKS